MEIERFEVGTFLSQAVAYGGLVWLSGMVTRQTPENQSPGEQAADILAQIEARLIAAGSSKSRLLSAQIWLTDIGDWGQVNEVWTAWLDGAPPPARATVQSKLYPPYQVEIAVVAAGIER